MKKTIRINHPIASNFGAIFSGKFDNLVKDGASEIDILINSSGGSVQAGLEVYDTIKNSPVPTTTIVNGISASIAGIIAMAGSNRVIKSYGIWHGHPVSGGGEDLRSKGQNSIETIMAERTGLDKEKIHEILTKETFFSPKEAKSLGIFTEITNCKGNLFLNNSFAPEEAMNFFNNEQKMEDANLKKIEELEASLVEANKKLEASIEAEAQIKTLSARLEAMENKENADRIETAISQAIENKRITEESAKTWRDLSSDVGLENVEKLLASLGKVENVPTPAPSPDIQNKGKEVEGKDYDWYQKNDPEALRDMRKNEPEIFNALFEKQYGKLK